MYQTREAEKQAEFLLVLVTKSADYLVVKDSAKVDEDSLSTKMA